MKTAISVPDQIFDRVENRVATLGISRSEFYTLAAQLYLEQLDNRLLRDEINAAISLAGEDDSSKFAVIAGRRFLAQSDDEW